MNTEFQIKDEFQNIEDEVKAFIYDFDKVGETIYKGSRNELKAKEIHGVKLNIKRFKTPNLVNRFVYRRFRESKAKRSFLHAQRLLENNIGTPKPIAYQENFTSLGLLESYYVSIHEDYDFTFREIITQVNLPDREQVLKAFTAFTFKMHENHILFLDHSPGNTLIKRKPDGEYAFFLVDLNRMIFKKLSKLERFKNFERLTTDPKLIEVISETYAELIGEKYAVVRKQIEEFSVEFQQKYQRKKKIKRKIKFWKSY